jgi:hypothetical protein
VKTKAEKYETRAVTYGARSANFRTGTRKYRKRLMAAKRALPVQNRAGGIKGRTFQGDVQPSIDWANGRAPQHEKRTVAFSIPQLFKEALWFRASKNIPKEHDH